MALDEEELTLNVKDKSSKGKDRLPVLSSMSGPSVGKKISASL